MKNTNQLFFDFDVIEEEFFISGDVENIKSMLPKLFISQCEDVAAAENRFQVGKGYLFTNGTGTGKTFVGLGIVKRFFVQDRTDILIVVPTDKKCIDWIDEGETLGLYVHKLVSIQDGGFGVSVTTYANFYQNEAINTRKWDLIVYDESHYLNQNEQGNYTSYLQKHTIVSNLPSSAKYKADFYPGVWTGEEDNRIFNKELYNKIVASLVEHTKVVFLSATPFAYHKSIKYADGCLFEINEKIEEEKETYHSYNEPSGFDKFLCENFGYRMRYNKCTIPESGVDVNLLERNFFETFKEKGVMSTRQINLEFDYSREFVTIDSEIGKFIDDGLELFWNQNFREEYPKLCRFISRKYNYNYITQLLECIKAKEIHKRIKKHIQLGRKVVIFHNYNNSLVGHPFRFETNELLKEDEFHFRNELSDEIMKFESNYPQYWNLELSDLQNTRRSILKHFQTAREYNGTVNKKNRDKTIKDFNNDNSDVNILIVQIKAGKEGISVHDKTGSYQRVLINLGLPTAPTDAIQTEGRIYREGLMSNAIYEYLTLQTNTEKFAFATKIAERSKTAENLAMGNLARDLETAFKTGYVNSNHSKPNINQGFGGKEADKFLFNISEFDKSKTFYFQRLKKSSKNKSKEGADYFATPEPLGFKMVEWLNPKSDEKGLEPSSGHGAIARFFPGNTTNHFVEQSHFLSSELAINVNGTVHIQSFEDYYIGNKFDFIGMNPPFGVGGKTAMEHLNKAFRHLNGNGSRLLAIIPNGGSMQKRLDNFFDNPDNRRYKLAGELILPSCTFERAGTNVSCKIIKVIYDSYDVFESWKFSSVDLSHIKNITDLFIEIENLEF